MTDWNRRRFLGAAAAIGAYGLPLELRQRSTRARVVVVGAGVAGLTAAAELRRRGLDGDGEVIVVEAGNRIGGRVRTDRSLGYPVELGASWIHGGNRSNPVAGLANALRLPRVTTDYESVAAYAGNGRRLSDDALGEGVESGGGEEVGDDLAHDHRDDATNEEEQRRRRQHGVDIKRVECAVAIRVARDPDCKVHGRR